MLLQRMRVLQRSRFRTLFASSCMYRVSFILRSSLTRRLVVSVDTSRITALTDVVGASIFAFVGVRGWLHAVATCVSASAKKGSQLVIFLAQVSCDVHPA